MEILRVRKIKRGGWGNKFSKKKNNELKMASQVSSKLQNSNKHQAILEGDMLFDQSFLMKWLYKYHLSFRKTEVARTNYQ